ncbi:hypothetical protein [Phyllobacterium endophyticum]|nr:hypothetical protein [Phyllobacterium endophyticum]
MYEYAISAGEGTLIEHGNAAYFAMERIIFEVMSDRTLTLIFNRIG